MKCLFLLNSPSVITMPSPRGACLRGLCNGFSCTPTDSHSSSLPALPPQPCLICSFVQLVTSKLVSSETQRVPADQITGDVSQLGHPLTPVLSD